MTAEAPTSVSAARLIDGPDAAPATVLLAHGAGAPMDSPLMAAIAGGLAQQGWRVVRFEFPYMARQRILGRQQGPDRMPVLQEAFRQQARLEQTEQPDRPLFIGGKSMGGRVASLLVDELAASDGVCGCICLGYPFHPGDFQGRCHSLAATQAAWIKGSARIGSGSSGGLLIQTFSG
jgi:predicted alpha/beta-hydrolase family hydrolase